MAIKTPGHVERAGAVHQRHFRDGAVARRATNPLRDVNAMVEIDEIGQRVHARPGNRLVGAVAGAHRLKHRSVRPYLRVTGHAGLRGGKPGERGALNRSVAVAAVDTELTCMVPVAGGPGLLS